MPRRDSLLTEFDERLKASLALCSPAKRLGRIGHSPGLDDGRMLKPGQAIMNSSLLGVFGHPLPGILTFPDVSMEQLSMLDAQCDRGLCFILYLESLIEEDGRPALASVAGF